MTVRARASARTPLLPLEPQVLPAELRSLCVARWPPGHTGCESSAALRHACETLVRTIRATQPAASIERLLHLQDEVLRAFECAAESPRDSTVAR